MTLGTGEKKKVYFLIALAVVAGYFVYSNVLAGPPGVSAPAAAPRAAEAAAPLLMAAPVAKAERAPVSRNRSEEFHPVYLAKRIEDRPDPMKIDPTLKLELFAKVQEVGAAGGSRNLFLFGQEPPKEPVKLAGAEPIVPVHKNYGPPTPTPPAPPAPPAGPPPPPPITLKFYGFSTTTTSGRRMGYFLDGDDILLAREGDTLARKYRVVRIGPASAVLEDVDAKREQSVPLTAEGPGQ